MAPTLLLSFASFSVISAWLIGLIIFFLSFKEKNHLHKSSLRHWALGFILFTCTRIPNALFNMGIVFGSISLTGFYVATFILGVVAYLLFLRGTIILITDKKFWINVFPAVIFVIYTPLILALKFILAFSVANILGITRGFNYAIIIFLIAVIIKLLRAKPPILQPFIARAGAVIIAIGWLLFMISDLYIWQSIKTYPPQWWFAAVISSPYAYFGLIITQVIILIGLILLSCHAEVVRKHKYIPIGFSLLVLMTGAAITANTISHPEVNKADISLIASGSIHVSIDQNFETVVSVNASNPINAAEATISYPADILEVASLSKDNSIFNFWIEEPSFNNASGTIRFAGVLHDGREGFQSNGKILTIVFKPKKIGDTAIDFTNAQILAADGQGTDITGDKSGITYSITETKQQPSYDLNGDNKVSIIDISILVSHWGDTDNLQYDLNDNGKVDLTDLSILISKMGK